MAFTSGLKVGLGMAALPLTVPDRPSPPELDASQRRAWLACTCSDNPLVMVQGPPGTGKTAVLERVVRKLCTEGRSILITAPSNTAVDNVCRRILDLPVLRVSYSRQAVAPDVAAECWADDAEVVARFADKQARTGSCIFAGTHIGILRTPIVGEYLERHGDFDAVVFDEAGMGRAAELFLCMARGRRAILFGDHQQLPPHPLVTEVTDRLRREYGPLTRSEWALVQGSAMQWLGDIRGMPMFLMQRCYRCHNPRLMRFASTLFYDARVRASETAEYYRLPYADRVVKYPSSTLTFFSTSSLPADTRAEKLLVTGNRPGIENPLEARLCVAACIEFLKRYPASEIIIIAPYRMQTGLIRKLLREHPAVKAALDDDAGRLKTFVSTRVSTVDSFQGGESDAVIISYVRSGGTPGIGFVDDPNRVNVAHTRARREMVVVGDLEYLKKHARSDLFLRMERAFRRDGRIVSVTPETLREFGIAPEF
jgi:superfamily I DNA and/or RNA helicase